MSSETPNNSARTPDNETERVPNSAKRDTPGALGLVLEEPSGGDGIGHDGHGNDADPANFLMPHERKLPLSEQRQILAMRRRTDDDVDEEELDMRTGRRYMHWKMQNQQRDVGGGESHGPGSQKDRHTTDASIADLPAGSALALSDAGNPHKPLFDAVLKGVNDLDHAKTSLTPAEQVNLAGALTANMIQTPGFHRGERDPATISIAMSESGDRIFAINSQHLDAPNAMHTNVAVEHARHQPLDVSSAQAAVPLPPQPPVEERTQQAEIIPPRSIGALGT